MTAAEVQTLIDEIPCDLCYLSPGLAQYAVLAALIDVSEGNPVPTSTQELVAEANCLTCMVPPGLVPILMIQAIRGISGGGGGSGSVIGGAGAPVADPGVTFAVYIDTNDTTVYYWHSGAWH